MVLAKKVIDYNSTTEEIKRYLSLRQRIVLAINGNVFVFYDKHEGWSEALPIFVVKCNKHNILFLDYHHGNSNYFRCPQCLKRRE